MLWIKKMSFCIVNFCGMISPHVVFIGTCHSITWWDVTCTLIGSGESVCWRCLPAAWLQSAWQKGKKKGEKRQVGSPSSFGKEHKTNTTSGEMCVIKSLMLSMENNLSETTFALFSPCSVSPGPAGQWPRERAQGSIRAYSPPRAWFQSSEC